MAKMSVQQAAERLGVSAARVRQRIDDGGLVAEKIGGRWLVDLEASQAASPQAGRPVSPIAVWWSLLAPEVEHAAEQASPSRDAAFDDLVVEAKRLSRSSRDRAVRRLADALGDRDHDRLLAWLSNRSSRRRYVAAPSDLEALRKDPRLVLSGLSDPRSGMDDLRLAEGYLAAADLDAITADYWLERPAVDDHPNVVLHVSPIRPPAIGPMLLAADLAEHGGPREVLRAHELLDEAIDALIVADEQEAPA